MKKILVLLSLFTSLLAQSQVPAGYTGINMRYDWLAGKFRALHVPAFATTPSLTSGQWTGAGAVGIDSVLHKFFFYSGGSWRSVLTSASTWQQVLTAGPNLTGNNTSSFGTSYLKFTSAITSNGSLWVTNTGTGSGGTIGGSAALLAENSGSSGTQYGIYGHANGSGATNIAGYFLAESGTNNRAIIVPNGGGNVGIGTATPSAYAALELGETDHGFLGNRLNTTQMNAFISPPAGLMIYNTDSLAYCFYNGSVWIKFGTGSGGSTKFGKSGEDATAAENRAFNISTFNFNIQNASHGGMNFANSTRVYKFGNFNGDNGTQLNIDDVNAVIELKDAGSTGLFTNGLSSPNVTLKIAGTNYLSVNSDAAIHNFGRVNGTNPSIQLDENTNRMIFNNVPTGVGTKALRIDASGNIFKADTTAGGGGADALGTYIVQTATNAPANAQVLASLGTGMVKNTTTTGVLSIAAAATDYIAPTDRRAAFQTAVGTNANITAAAGTAYHLPAATLSTNRTIDMTNVNTNGDYVEFYNNEEGFTWSFTGQTVYDSDGATAVTELLVNCNSVVRRINGKLMISRL